LAPREDGVAIDTLVFQETSLAAPTGTGPAATSPIPEPHTGLLLALGLLLLAGQQRRFTRGRPTATAEIIAVRIAERKADQPAAIGAVGR
jgi:PEP-CTERM motif